MSGETWRRHPVFSRYEVSDHGRVRNAQGHVMRMFRNRAGYLSIGLRNGPGRSVTALVHQLVARAFIGLCPDGMEVLHGDGDPSNNRLGNLRYGTRSENVRDAVRHGRNANAAKARCSRGHLLADCNLRESTTHMQYGDGVGRGCVACHRMDGIVQRRRKAGLETPEPMRRAFADEKYAVVMAECVTRAPTEDLAVTSA